MKRGCCLENCTDLIQFALMDFKNKTAVFLYVYFIYGISYVFLPVLRLLDCVGSVFSIVLLKQSVGFNKKKKKSV